MLLEGSAEPENSATRQREMEQRLSRGSKGSFDAVGSPRGEAKALLTSPSGTMFGSQSSLVLQSSLSLEERKQRHLFGLPISAVAGAAYCSASVSMVSVARATGGPTPGAWVAQLGLHSTQTWSATPCTSLCAL